MVVIPVPIRAKRVKNLYVGGKIYWHNKNQPEKILWLV